MNTNTSLVNKDPSKLHFISKKGIKIYPVPGWFIEVDNNGSITTYKKKHSHNELDDAIWRGINYYYDMLLENKTKTNKT